MQTAILINRGGGSLGERGAVRRSDVTDALRKAGIDAELQWLEGSEIRAAAKAAVDAGVKLVIAGGGDGTISCVAGVLAGTDTALGVLPLGTLNHFARDLCISTDLDRAATLIASGRSRMVDVAEVNGRTFINNSAIGLYPLMVLDREAQQAKLGRSKRWALAVAAARTLFRFSSRRLALTIDDKKAQVDTPLLFVGNNAYRMQLPDAGKREALDRGELFVLVLRRKSRLGFCVASLRALFGRARKDDVVRLEHVESLRVDSHHSTLAVSLDGETVRLKPPLDYRIRKAVLKVIAP
jgi:YegS/Rv2252/BmrU family lipid kinase